MKRISWIIAIALLCGCARLPQTSQGDSQWTVERANQWSAAEPWLVGCNFTPSSAVNELEMWQEASFDPATIDRELGWAQELGFTSVRVFLHDLLWQQDAQGFLKRMDQFLAMADKHHIGVMFVLFDGVWNPYPRLGTQPAPRPHIHNSGWVQSPGHEILSDPSRYEELKPYVQGVVRRFGHDKRVQVWDVFNEPDNPNRVYGEPADKEAKACLLLNDVFLWARQVHPSQPLTSGVWKGNWSDDSKLSPIQKIQLQESDVISFHNYADWANMSGNLDSLRRFGRPILCTEYMARPNGSHFDPNLGNLKKEGVAAYSWGFVSGKTQTIYPWDSWDKPYTNEPAIWFHDILRTDGTPYDSNEVKYIKRITSGP